MLLQPVAVGKRQTFRNRLAMASLTRNRCVDSCKPGPAQVKYYAERARDGPGIIISEGILVDWAGLDWPHVPVLVTNEQAQAWRKVVDAVHGEGGQIYFQAWHAGRAQNEDMPAMKASGRPVLAPSPIPAEGGRYHDLDGNPGHTLNVKAIENPQDLVETYRGSIILAKEAGFDGVELLCTGGYLPQQFLISRANKRTDAYGGSVEHRCRFILELVTTASDVFGGPEYIAVKVGPSDVLNDSVVDFNEMQETYSYLIKALVRLKVGVITICRRGTSVGINYGDDLSKLVRPEGFPLPPNCDPVLEFGRLVKSPGSHSLLMANHGYTIEEGEKLLEEGKIDMLMVGRPFIYNPDLVTRIRKGLPFAENHRGAAVNYGPYHTPDEYYNDWPVAAT